MLRIAIADDHQIVIDGLKHMLESEPGVDVVGEANDGGQLVALLQRTQVDVVLLDIDMPVMNGIAACRKLTKTHPDIKIVALTMMQEASIIRKMLEAGAVGYLMKNTGQQELLACLEAVRSGKTYYSRAVSDVILNDMSGSNKTATTQFPRLSRREKQILRLIVDEMTTGEIAEQLNISFGTVETHRRNIMHKLGARNAVGMVRIALENGLLD